MNAVVYTSNTGYTKEYAQMLGEKLSLPVCSLKDAGKVLEADCEIIYLGWLMAGTVKGYRKAARRYRVKAVCGVGMGKSGSQLAEMRKNNSVPDEVALFSMQGGLDVTRLRGVYKFMMNTMKNTLGRKLAQKPDKTAEEEDVLDLLQNGGNRVNEQALEPLLQWCEARFATVRQA